MSESGCASGHPLTVREEAAVTIAKTSTKLLPLSEVVEASVSEEARLNGSAL